MRASSLLPVLAFVLGARGAAAAPTPAETKAEARGLERELDILNDRLRDMNEAAVRATAGDGSLAAELDTYDPGNETSSDISAKARRIWAGYHRAMVPLVVRTTVIARRLRRYHETGELPPDDTDAAALAREIDAPPTSARPVDDLALDLKSLLKQLRLKEPRRESLPRAEPVLVRAKPAAVKPGFAPDRGTGRSEVDPVPELIRQLAAPEPSQRALAADELGGRGLEASVAIPALRRALSDRDPRVRASAALALGAAGGAGVEADLRSALKDKDEDVRFSARAALRRLFPGR